jgi:hypothetical protein
VCHDKQNRPNLNTNWFMCLNVDTFAYLLNNDESVFWIKDYVLVER